MARKKIYNLLSRRTPNFSPKLGVISLVVIILVVAALELTNITHIFHKEKVPGVIPSKPSSASQSINSSPNTKEAPKATSPTPSNSKTPSSTGGEVSSNAPLIAPYGDFVSNHHPGGGTSSNEVSVCNTTPGATCYIKLTNGQTATQLPPQTVGADGSTIWNWNIDKDAHLTKGEWKITAVASLNGQTKSTDDQLKLVIQ